MSEESEKIKRLMELLAEEATWQGRLNGHEGQAKVAEREEIFCKERMIEAEKEGSYDVARYWERKGRRAFARKEYHREKAEEARKKLEEIRAEIDKLIGGEEK